MASKGNPGDIARNKKAFHDYEILERFEAGIELKGTEVKSLRAGNVNVKDTYAVFKEGELFVTNLHIHPYEQGNRNNHDPERLRKLLLHKRELRRLFGKMREKGLTLIPLRLYFKRNIVKVEVGLCRGKKLYDKRADIKKRDLDRDMERYEKR